MPDALRNTDSRPTIIDWSKWRAANDEARRRGLNPGHFRRQCKRMQKVGLAMFASHPDGGAAQWWVRIEDDSTGPCSGVGVGDAEAMPDDWYCFTDKQREVAMHRAECVRRFRLAKQTRAGRIGDWLDSLLESLSAQYPDLNGVRRSALYTWDAKYVRGVDVVKLVDKRGGDTRSSGGDDAWQYFESIYLDDRQPSVRQCWDRTASMASDRGWAWCSYHSCRRQLDERIAPAKQMRLRQPAKYKQTLMPTIEQDAERFAAGRCWVGDHSPLDLICNYKGKLIRPWITAWQDWRTRRIVGWVLSPQPDSATILAAFRRGMHDPRNMGGPSEVITDNGRDYDCYSFTGQTKHDRRSRVLAAGYIDEAQFHGVFGMLSITPHFSIAYTPNGKARMERWFLTLHETFDVTFPTYTGRDPDHKPESLKAVLRDRRNVPTFDHVAMRLAEFIAGFNADADHAVDDLLDTEAGRRLSPDEAMSRWCADRRVFREGVLEMALKHWHQPRSVRGQGVTLTINGAKISFGRTNLDLMRWKGRRDKVRVAYDPDDLRQVWVYDPKFRLIAIAEANQFGGLPDEAAPGTKHVKDQMREIRAYDRAVRTVAARPELQYTTRQEQIARRAVTEAVADLQSANEPSLKPVESALDGAAERAALTGSAGVTRMAAGGETLPVDDPPLDLRDYLGDAATHDDQDDEPLRLSDYLASHEPEAHDFDE